MSRKKKDIILQPWTSARPDCREKSYVMEGDTLRKSNAWQALTLNARNTYSCMVHECRGKREFTFPLAVAQEYGIPKNSLTRSVHELIGAGLISRRSGKTVRKPNLYAFEWGWKRNEENKQDPPTW